MRHKIIKITASLMFVIALINSSFGIANNPLENNPLSASGLSMIEDIEDLSNQATKKDEAAVIKCWTKLSWYTPILKNS
jgi:hypothetical protein